MSLALPRVARNAHCARELVFFLLFGGMAALANLAVGWLLYGAGFFPGLPYWCATGFAAATGLVVSFGLNYSFNFKYRQRSVVQQFSTFCIVAGVGVVLTSGLSDALWHLFDKYFHTAFYLGTLIINPKFAAHFIAVGLVPLYSFPAHRAFSFNIGIWARLQQLKLQIAEKI